VVVSLVVGLAFEFTAVRGRAVSAAWRSAERLFLGRVETLELELRDGSRRALRLRTPPLLPSGLTEAEETSGAPREADLGGRAPANARELGLPPRGAARTAVAVRAVELGSHDWPPLPVRVCGPLGLAWWSRRVATGARTTV